MIDFLLNVILVLLIIFVISMILVQVIAAGVIAKIFNHMEDEDE